MEDESDGPPFQVNHKLGDNDEGTPDTLNSPETENDMEENRNNKTDLVKVNGDKSLDESDTAGEADSSDCDALVIDESVKPKRAKRKSKVKSPCFRGFEVTHSNPYFNESLFELSQLHHSLFDLNKNKANEATVTKSNEVTESVNTNNLKPRKGHKKNNPKLREYAQYLGLQPSVQFKCNKCYRTGFPSLGSLNDHLMQCTSELTSAPPVEINSSSAPSTNIRVRRKVFLCSACGTYYENWNMFLHMCEVHKRYVCLYCLGLFSHSEDLSNHLISKHNCIPRRIQAVEDFVNIYPEPLFLMCCDCQKVFNERDNYFYHKCFGVAKKFVNKTSKQSKQNKAHVEHVTGDTNIEMLTKDDVADDNDEDMKNCEAEDEPLLNNTENTSKTMATTNESETDLSKNEEQGFENETAEKSDENIEEDNERTVTPSVEDNEKSNCNEDISNETFSAKDTTENCLSGEETKIVSEPECDSDTKLSDAIESADETKETRKVPKVTLRLPKPGSYPEIKDCEESDKLEEMEVDQEQGDDVSQEEVDKKEEEEVQTNTEPQLQVAGPDVNIVELELEQPLDKFEIRSLIQKCLRATIPVCIYCNHARKIAVNGMQLALHAIAEHRYSAVVNSITAEELIPESFVARIKESFKELENVYFNLESTLNEEAITFSHVFECFQCRYSTTVHKELYLHNRKSHAKTILLCIMCKSNFYSYSELICHLCPGLYALENDVQFRCCMCVGDDLPSAFRLMVHLRKRHHVCDVCLEMCHNQSRLSNHVWKHKLHHLCYRCGIAYRNKPDITKHLFWKHGTESVLCKKCLQKKWPHVYHFCIPPNSFVCEECNLTFTRAVSLKVHKRTHSDNKPHSCTIDNCTESFVSKKLLLKHEFKHREPPEEQQIKEVVEDERNGDAKEDVKEKKEESEVVEGGNEGVEDKPVEKPKPKVDVYDLPALNLSESDSSDSEEEKQKESKPEVEVEQEVEEPVTAATSMEVDMVETATTDIKQDSGEVTEKPVPILENIWDDFKNYQASKGKVDNILTTDMDKPEPEPTTSSAIEDQLQQIDVIMQDHDYCFITEPVTKDNLNEISTDLSQSLDHDYCSPKGQTMLSPQKIEEVKPEEIIKEKEGKVPKKKIDGNSSDSSSSDSDSSSCTCGSNCSCSTSSGSSSSSDSSNSDSSTSEGRRRQQARREKRREKQKNKNKENSNTVVDVVAMDNKPSVQFEAPIQESDLETTESETDEDFYDKQPQKLANKILAEKREKLLAQIGPIANGTLIENSRPSTPSLPEEEVNKPKKKSKSKKRKKKKSSKYEHANSSRNRDGVPSGYQFYQTPTVASLTLSLSRNSPVLVATPNTVPNPPHFDNYISGSDDSNLRASKRRRVPNKFYGYSSEEEQEKAQPPQPKWRKADLPSPVRQVTSSPLLVPPITIKTVQPPQPVVEPISIRTTSQPGEMRVQPTRPTVPPMRMVPPRPPPTREAESDSNESSSADEPHQPPLMKENQTALYCYCQCPYDEVSEMIGCDSSDCVIEWFHFECVGIMVPPKGQWFCPDCRKKKQQRKDLLQT